MVSSILEKKRVKTLQLNYIQAQVTGFFNKDHKIFNTDHSLILNQ